MSSSAKEKWYAVQTRSNSERRVVAELASYGVTNYWPTISEVRQWSDRRLLIDRPIFPGYVFAKFRDSTENRLRVLKTAGAVRILGSSSGIEPVPETELEAIRRMLSSRLSCFAHPFLSEGAWVRVRRGALKGVEGRLIRVKSESRLVLAITLLSQSIAAEIDIQNVELLRPA